jgi:magnesium transporter
MSRLTNKTRQKKLGLAPGSLVFTGDAKTEPTKMSVLDYDVNEFQEYELDKPEGAFPFKDSPSISWLNVDSVHDVDIITRIGDHFEIHPLVLEDILHTSQRPKVEEFDGYLYIVLRMLYYDEKGIDLRSEQVSLIVGPTYVISFQENTGDVFDPVRNRIRSAVGRIRKKGSDYLAYALLDVIIDHYFSVLETMSYQTEELDATIMLDPSPSAMHRIGTLRRELILLRKAVWPVREMLGQLEKSESKFINKDIRPFLRDAYDHTIQAIDIVESLRDMISVLRDSYQSVLSNRMNEIMKVLTIISTIFIPITFIAGVYGMNFENMPELHSAMGYPIALVAMFLIGLSLAGYFRWKKWI